MIKNLSQIEVNIENKIFRFIVDYDTPLSNVKEALFQIQRYIGQIEENAKSQLASQEKPEEQQTPE